MENSTVGLTLLPPGRTVPLDRDGLGGHDDEVLDRYRPHDRAERREVAVVLAWCEPEGGRDPGLLEVRLDGRVLGRLDHRTSQQYARLVDDVLDRGELPACTARMRSTAHGVVVELQMPRVAASHAAGDEAAEPATTRLPRSLPDRGSRPDHAEAGPPAEAPRKPSPTRRHEAPAAQAAQTAVSGATPEAVPDPAPAPTPVPVPIPAPAPVPDAEVTAIHRVAVPPPRTSPDPLIGFRPAADDWSPPPLEAFPAVLVDWSVGEPAPRARRAGPWWIAAGVAAVLLTAGLVGRAAVNEPASPQAVVTTPVPPPRTTAPAVSTTSATPSTAPSAARTSKSKARPAKPSTTRRATPSTTRRATPTTTGRASPVRYPNCASARAAGAAPLTLGEPGYSLALDEDRDGTACE